MKMEVIAEITPIENGRFKLEVWRVAAAPAAMPSKSLEWSETYFDREAAKQAARNAGIKTIRG